MAGAGEPKTITLRPAHLGEHHLLTDLCRRSKAHWGYDGAFMQAIWNEVVVTEEDVGEGRTTVAEREGVPVGVTVIRMWADDSGTAEFDLLFVDPQAIGSGVGRRLWVAFATDAKKRGAKRLYIEADPNAVPFYEHMGAVLTGELTRPVPPNRQLPILVFELAP
jgi:GNAT superfamily N-acetyltransferase